MAEAKIFRGRSADIRPILDEDAWFKTLPPRLADMIIDRGVRRDFADGQIIYASGDPPTGQFAVLSGQARLIANTRVGKAVLYRILRPGNWFGHLSVLDNKPRFQDAIAVGPTSVLMLTKPAFDAIIDVEPRYALNFAHLICEHIRIAMDSMAEMMTMPLPHRLAQVVLITTDLSKTPGDHSRVTQEALAAMTGASRQRVNRILRCWEDEDVVAIEYGRIVVRDRQRLAEMARYGEG